MEEFNLSNFFVLIYIYAYFRNVTFASDCLLSARSGSWGARDSLKVDGSFCWDTYRTADFFE
ncbi:hypothetical protein C3432_14650 [Citrobacter amalonaticus]|uniref:Uncharacterized protein n=1 Tax=Citrobacter amalonaticus TaxID=35703 RepID=A0A2S4RWG4_CITAM|nr:hypothetical protein C3432_14650 [Citrobacter amalonaticus]POT75169.1 hypothetical protein C3436_15120 [Citrobacter amalonaticus]POU64698.1 hypothetical protein C3430_16140 [Citrobacter amalonaticus]POV04534.1 hypothetical protein C3424_15460 [Citrobacter amalonaticus]